MNVQVQDIAYFLPAQKVTNDDLRRENPSWNFGKLEQRVGVKSRHVAKPDETALDLAFQSCLKLFEKNPDLKSKIDAIVFCTQSSDYIMPPNSCILHGLLGLNEEVFAMDFNLACSGYVYGLTIAQGLIRAGTAKNVLLVTADTYSKYIHEGDRSTRVLFGDGAAASWICASSAQEGIQDILCATSGVGYRKFMIPAGGCRIPKSDETCAEKVDVVGNIRTQENIQMDGSGILTFVKEKVPAQVGQILARNGITIKDIDLVIFHQASRLALDYLNQKFELRPEQTFSNIENIGNTVSASIPIALRDALDQGRIKKGDRLLLSGFGVGLSYGTALLRY